MFDQFYNEVYIRFSNFGKLPLCNQRSERAPKLFGFCFPLCWRCTAIILGWKLIAPLLANLFGNIVLTLVQKGLLISILLIPALIDGGNQYYFQKKESTNFLRIITGLPAGFAIYLFIEIFKFRVN